MKEPNMMTDSECREEIKNLSKRIKFLRDNGRYTIADSLQGRLDQLQSIREQLNEE